MAVKNYCTMNGQLIGEYEGTRSTDYILDGLGSVIATFRSTGTIQNQYRYSGYGQQVYRSGTGTDPYFLWVGGWGYRTRGMVYVRLRTYYEDAAVWTSVDPLWPDESAYGYVQSAPVSGVDPTGQSMDGDAACYTRFKQYGECDNPMNVIKLIIDCGASGSVPCILAKASPVVDPRTGKCADCCVVCFPSCKKYVDLGGVLCSGSRRSDILKCAKHSLRKLKPDKLDPKSPKIDPALSCPELGLGQKCQPAGERLHIVYTCAKRKSDVRKRVISSVCCPCYEKGVIRIVCFNPKECHSD